MTRIAPLLLCLASLPVADDDRPAATIVAEIDAIVVPDPSRFRANTENAKVATMNARKARTKRAALIRELDQAHPDHADLARLLPVRWRDLWATAPGSAIVDEIDAAVARRPDDAEFGVEAAYARAFVTASTKLRGRKPDVAGAGAAVDEFVDRAPGDLRGIDLLDMILAARGPAALREIEDRILDKFPGSLRALTIGKVRKSAEAVGKPFDLEVRDFLTNEAISLAKLKGQGKVVVVDFWATWCGPCIDELPRMKQLYGRFAPRGVEFIGVVLDRGSEPDELAKVRDAVAHHGIPWPQYRPEGGSSGTFAREWSIEAVPTIFVIDADGKVVDRDARGHLEARLNSLLAAGPRRP